MGGSDHNRVGQTAVDNILEHHGVKGMKWGVRKGNLGATRLDLPSGRVSTIPFTRRAAKNPTSRSAEKTAVATHKMSLALRRSANDPNGSIQKFNREWRSSGKSVLKSHRNEYDSKLSSLMTEEVNKFTKSGTEARVHIVRVKGDNHPEVHLIVAKSKPALDGYKRGLVESSDVEMVHKQTNAVPDEVLIFVAEVDSDGFVTDMTPKRPSMTHDDFVGKFLAQSGVKGMKWGVRKNTSSLAARVEHARYKKLVSDLKSFKSTKQLNDFLDRHINEHGHETFLKVRGQDVSRDNKTVNTEIVTYKNTHLEPKEWNKLPAKDRFEDMVLKTKNDAPIEHIDFVGNFLAQSGVKGMKWGVRRSRAELARAATKRLGAKVSDIRTTRAAKAASRESGANHPVRRVSDQELQALVNRMRLEQDFRRLTAEMAPKPKADGFIKSLLKENGKRQLSRVARSALDIAVERAFEKAGASGGKHALDTSNKEFSRDLSKALATSRKKK